MALTCARCGTQNPDGNRFCTNCGTPLIPAAAQVPSPPVAVGAGAGYAAPPAQAPPPAYAPPPGYQSPYYAPAPGAPSPAIHRTPWMVVIAVVVVSVLVLGGLGTALALTLGKHNTQGSTFGALSSPSPASTPSPDSASPTPTSQPSPSGTGSTVSTSTLSVAVPAGWQVVNKDDNSVTLQSPDGDGTVTVASGQSSPPQTAQQLKDSIDKSLTQHYPDAAECPNSTSNTGPISGEPGIFWMMCFTATSGGQSLSIAEPLWTGANADGSVAYVVVLQTTQDNIDSFVQKTVPILKDGITWELK